MDPLLAQDDLRFLRELTRDTVEASRVHPGERVGSSPPNTTGSTLIRPGGRDCYPAFWIRDFAMSLPSGFITPDEALTHLRLIAKCQNGPQERRLNSGGIIPPYAIPDHINFDGSPVFYPGTMSAGEDQGGEPFGVLPPADDHYEFIDIAFWLVTARKQLEFLQEKIDGIALLDRLKRAFDVPASDAATGGMFATTTEQRAVGFGFCDAVQMSGSILFPSLLRFRAGSQLADLYEMLNKPDEAQHYLQIADSIRTHVIPIFADANGKHGWLLAATGRCRQPDVWGTLFALNLQILPEQFAARARETIVAAVRDKSITSLAAVRHVPINFDASPATAWEKVVPGIAGGTYQNGGYWHTATGWLVRAISDSHPDLARSIAREYVAHLREHDFRRGPAHGAPYECFQQGGRSPQNAVYMTSVTVPCAVFTSLNRT